MACVYLQFWHLIAVYVSNAVSQSMFLLRGKEPVLCGRCRNTFP